MTRFSIKGRPTRCSTEYVRAWLHASACVLAYHNKVLPPVIDVDLKPKIPNVANNIIGMWVVDSNWMILKKDLPPEKMATAILHEMIHAACGDFGKNTDEKCCSTLTARLKPHVHALAQPLIDDTYRRAAFIAHTKLSYVVEEDHYDRDQYRSVGVDDLHARRRQSRAKTQ